MARVRAKAVEGEMAAVEGEMAAVE